MLVLCQTCNRLKGGYTSSSSLEIGMQLRLLLRREPLLLPQNFKLRSQHALSLHQDGKLVFHGVSLLLLSIGLFSYSSLHGGDYPLVFSSMLLQVTHVLQEHLVL